MHKIAIVGGGYAGFSAALKLQKRLRRGEAELTIIEPLPYMTYQPFLPDVVGGSIEPRHVGVSLRRNLPRTKVIAGTAARIDHEHRRITVRPEIGADFDVPYDIVVVTAGAITRTFPIPGVIENAIGLKHVEEAVAIRDHMLTALDEAALLPTGPERARLLTVTFVGGGFTGVEGFGELLSFATVLLKRYPEIDFSELNFHLVEASPRILPEVTDRPGTWVVESLVRRGGHVHLGTHVVSADGGNLILSDGETFASGLIVWATGNGANPTVANRSDLPVDERGLIRVRADLRVGTDAGFIPDAWAAGDDAAVPDLTSKVAGARTVPNAQHAVRQGKLVAANVVASLRGDLPRQYLHHSWGAVATLGFGRGIFQYRGVVIKGFPAWMLHRGYHVLAIPTWDRKLRVLAGWMSAVFGGRDMVSLASTQHPRAAFVSAGAPPPE